MAATQQQLLNARRQRIERRGLALPAIRQRGGYFNTPSVHDTAFGDLLLALFTPIGGRAMQRGFGSGLHLILFEPNVSELHQEIFFIVKDTAQKWVPHVTIRGVEVSRKDRKVQIRVSFSLVDDGEITTRFLEVRRDQTIKVLASARIS
jgi:phage baseplate assembly protein W